MYPGSEAQLPNDNFAQVLFAMSSELPESMVALAKQKVNPSIKSGDRGFVFNADASEIVNMITIATAPAVNPDR